MVAGVFVGVVCMYCWKCGQPIKLRTVFQGPVGAGSRARQGSMKGNHLLAFAAPARTLQPWTAP
jgi:hypothetical protein